MKRAKKWTMTLIAALVVLAAITGTAFAAYVPTKGTYSTYDNYSKKWTKRGSFTASYSGSGKLKKVTKKYDWEEFTTTYSSKYTWKGDYLKKLVEKSGDNYKKEGKKTHYNREVKWTTKKKKTTKITYTIDAKYSTGETYKNTSNETFKWKKNKATVTNKYSSTENGKKKSGRSKFTVKLKNGRTVKEEWPDSTSSYTYYKKGLRKSYTSKGEKYESKSWYGKNGFIKKSTSGGTYWSDSESGTYTMTSVYDWKYKSGKPVSVTVTTTNKYDNGSTWTEKRKWEFSKTKKVSRNWNCDAVGNWAGIEF